MLVVNKRPVRCFRGFATLPFLANVEVFYTVPEFGYDNSLFTCIDCGTLFVLDTSDHSIKPIGQATADIACPQCHRQLAVTLRAYPATFRHTDGRVGQFEPTRFIPPHSESLVMEFFDLAST